VADAPAVESLLELAAQIVSAHVADNAVAPEPLPALIHEVYRTLIDVEKGSVEPDKPKPAVPIDKSRPPHLPGGRETFLHA
jgi:predicted transcriptional regulator